MAKQSKREEIITSEQINEMIERSEDTGRKDFIGKSRRSDKNMLTSEDIDKKLQEEFNPVKLTEAALNEAKVTALNEVKIKKDLPYDRVRLEFLRMTIGPVQNFYTTLGNMLLSISERIGVIESEFLKLKVKQSLYEDYLKYTTEQNRIVTLDEFLEYFRNKEKESENKKS